LNTRIIFRVVETTFDRTSTSLNVDTLWNSDIVADQFLFHLAFFNPEILNISGIGRGVYLVSAVEIRAKKDSTLKR
jgi:hypothetical protein